MSGTSMDGIDAALVEFESSRRFRLIECSFTPFDSDLKRRISHTAQNNSLLKCNEDSPLHKELATLYSEAAIKLIEQAGLSIDSITAIANHGQTVKHEPKQVPPLSLQLGDGQIIADQTNIQTICQFRQADLNAGGQGAPLMPAFHKAAFGTSQSNFIVNIGGISNISFLREPLLGYDTGPGNCLMDQWIQNSLHEDYDKNGAWAKTANTNEQLLAHLLEDDYFSQPAPKSTGTDYFNLKWLQDKLLPELDAATIQRTLLQLTVESIASEILSLSKTGSIYVCGGGANNPVLMNNLEQRLENFSVSTTDTLGLPSDQLEAIGFAWLGYCYNHKINSNAPSVTGANKECILGESFLPKATDC